MLFKCLHPLRLIHPYTHDPIYVPCGKCDACLNHRSQIWSMRIQQESKSHKFSYTFEIDYVEEKIPKLRFHDDCLENVSEGIYIPFNELFSDNMRPEDYRFLANRQYVPYNSKKNVQNFFKRLRVNLTRHFGLSETEARFRYFAVGEYGPSTFRPHVHVYLWFDSDRFKEVLSKVLRESWSFGRVRALKPEHEGSAAYVANYFTCDAHLPAIYQNPKIKQFKLCSRRPPLGTLPLYSEEVRNMFHSETFTITVPKQGEFVDIPLPKLYADRLFPVLPFLDKANSFERNQIYKFPLRFQSFADFKKAVEDLAISNRDNGNSEIFYSYLGLPSHENRVYHDFVEVPRSDLTPDTFLSRYCCALYHESLNRFKKRFPDLDSSFNNWHSLHHWYSISYHVLAMSSIYNVSISNYVKQIFRYAERTNYLYLINQLNFEEVYSKYHHVSQLLNLDYSFFIRLKDSPLSEYSDSDWLILETFGFDLETFDKSQLDEVDFYNLPNYEFFSALEKHKREKNTKTKVNRDFLLSRLNDPRYKWALEYHHLIQTNSKNER